MAAIPRGLSLCARTHVQGLGAHYCFQIAVFGDSQQVLPYTEAFLDNCDPNGQQHKHNACQGVTQPLGQRACPPLTIPQPLTWLLPLPVISQSPFTNGHPSLGTPHPLVFLKVRSAFPGLWVFFSPLKQPRMTLENFRLPGYCIVGPQRKERVGNTRLKILEGERIGARTHQGPQSPELYKTKNMERTR